MLFSPFKVLNDLYHSNKSAGYIVMSHESRVLKYDSHIIYISYSFLDLDSLSQHPTNIFCLAGSVQQSPYDWIRWKWKIWMLDMACLFSFVVEYY